MFEQALRHIHSRFRGNGDLEAILAGVAGAGDDAAHIVKVGFGDIHEAHRRDVRPEFAENRSGPGSLKGDQGTVGQHGHVADAAETVLEMRKIGILAGRVDDEEEMIAAIDDHQVVENAACGIGEEAVALSAFREAENIRRHELFQRQRRVLDFSRFRPHDDLSHVGHVEEAAAARVCRCSFNTPSGYWTGMS